VGATANGSPLCFGRQLGEGRGLGADDLNRSMRSPATTFRFYLGRPGVLFCPWEARWCVLRAGVARGALKPMITHGWGPYWPSVVDRIVVGSTQFKDNVNNSNSYSDKWRRRRDSNPGYAFGAYNGLANRRLQPLGHVSAFVNRALIRSHKRTKPKIATRLPPVQCLVVSCASASRRRMIGPRNLRNRCIASISFGACS
jgi:hypothetical protein